MGRDYGTKVAVSRVGVSAVPAGAGIGAAAGAGIGAAAGGAAGAAAVVAAGATEGAGLALVPGIMSEVVYLQCIISVSVVGR